MKPLRKLLIIVILICTSFFSLFSQDVSYQIEAECQTNYLKTASQTRIFVNGDSLKIKDVIYEQCCASFQMQFSEIGADSIQIVVSDTSSVLCDCMCNLDFKATIGNLDLSNLKVLYNGYWYDVNKPYHPLIETGKRWKTMMYYVIPDYMNTAIRYEYTIESDKGRYFCWNGIQYIEVKAKQKLPDQNIDTLASVFIREENGKVYWLDPTNLPVDGCDEYLLYDFNASIRDTLTIGKDSIRFVVVPIDSLQDRYSFVDSTHYMGRRWIALDYLNEYGQTGLYALWLEGVGDVRGLFKSADDDFLLTGANWALTCCALNGSPIYQDQSIQECNPLQASDIQMGSAFRIYPNPATNSIQVDELNSTNNMEYVIENLQGKVVDQGRLLQPTISFNLQHGMYLVRILRDGQMIWNEKLLIE